MESMTDLISLKKGGFFEAALVRLQKKPRILGRNLAFIDVRQEARVEFNCCITNKSQLIQQLKSLKEGDFILISGIMGKEYNKIDVTEMQTYSSRNKGKMSSECSNSINNEEVSLAIPYGGCDIDYDHNVHNILASRVLGQSKDLFRRIIEYLPSEELDTCILPVSTFCAAEALSFLRSSCRYVRYINLDVALYSIFQSARHLVNWCAKPVDKFRSQSEYSQLMLCGAHLCRLSLRRNNSSHFGAWVDKDVVDTLHLLAENQPPNEEQHYSTKLQMKFLEAACIQLSTLNIDSNRNHIHQLGYGLHNSPRWFPEKGWAVSWTRPLLKCNILCSELRNAGNNFFGIDWLWEKI